MDEVHPAEAPVVVRERPRLRLDDSVLARDGHAVGLGHFLHALVGELLDDAEEVRVASVQLAGVRVVDAGARLVREVDFDAAIVGRQEHEADTLLEDVLQALGEHGHVRVGVRENLDELLVEEVAELVAVLAFHLGGERVGEEKVLRGVDVEREGVHGRDGAVLRHGLRVGLVEHDHVRIHARVVALALVFHAEEVGAFLGEVHDLVYDALFLLRVGELRVRVDLLRLEGRDGFFDDFFLFGCH